ncbi:hypothetical protein BGX24_000216 [Mortierella sp. AD032]|nr:hypothetical protein BGX24_000216 [Mortierella sp. AD032]
MVQHKTRGARPPSEHVSLKTWIRNAPWSQYFKDGCRLIVKSPFNFFVFFCCLSVVVWGAFLVLLMGNMVKLKDDATQKLWIEIASQVLNGFFTLANVPVHPKRFIGFVRGIRVLREDKAVQQQFLARFSNRSGRDAIDLPTATAGSNEQEQEQELLKRLRFYRCFPGYGRERIEAGVISMEQDNYTPPQFDSKADMRSRTMDRTETKVVVSRSRSRSKSQRRSMSVDLVSVSDGDSDPSASGLHPVVGLDGQDSTPASGSPSLSTATSPAPLLSPTMRLRVDIAEEELNELLAEETHRVVHSVVLPFLPFPLDVADDSSNDTSSTVNGSAGQDTGESMTRLEEGHGSMPIRSRVIQRGASYTALPRSSPSRRISPRTRSRTLTMSMADDTPISSELPRRPTFVIHEDHGSAGAHSRSGSHAGLGISSAQSPPDSSANSKKKAPPPPVPMPEALTQEQMDWVDEHDAGLLKRMGRLQRAWPWYNYTIPSGIEPVDFFVHPEEQPPLSTTSNILLSSSPTTLVVSPARFSLIVGSFNLNSMIQEILCGFMWGMNYHVRPGWVVGTGMAFGCLAAIVPSVLIMLHEQAMSRMRVVATAEEAIQDALDEKKVVSRP